TSGSVMFRAASLSRMDMGTSLSVPGALELGRVNIDRVPTLDRDAIAATAALIVPYIRTTPVVELDAADLGLPSFPLTLKLEQLQHAGSFKTRGAFANLLLREVPPAGVVAASGGNHGAAVAYAARRRGVPAKIFVPEISSPSKLQRIR